MNIKMVKKLIKNIYKNINVLIFKFNYIKLKNIKHSLNIKFLMGIGDWGLDDMGFFFPFVQFPLSSLF